ncbi:MAG: signal peptidase II, partial [Halomonas sp.]
MPNAANTPNATNASERPPMKRPLSWLWIAAAVIVLDLLTKYVASSQLGYAQPVEVLPFFNLT